MTEVYFKSFWSIIKTREFRDSIVMITNVAIGVCAKNQLLNHASELKKEECKRGPYPKWESCFKRDFAQFDELDELDRITGA